MDLEQRFAVEQVLSAEPIVCHGRRGMSRLILVGDKLCKINRKAWAVWKAKGVRCSYPGCSAVGKYFCKRTLKLFTGDGVQMTLDHIIPKSKGGTKNIRNLQPMCQRCNTLKGNTILSPLAEMV